MDTRVCDVAGHRETTRATTSGTHLARARALIRVARGGLSRRTRITRFRATSPVRSSRHDGPRHVRGREGGDARVRRGRGGSGLLQATAAGVLARPRARGERRHRGRPFPRTERARRGASTRRPPTARGPPRPRDPARNPILALPVTIVRASLGIVFGVVGLGIRVFGGVLSAVLPPLSPAAHVRSPTPSEARWTTQSPPRRDSPRPTRRVRRCPRARFPRVLPPRRPPRGPGPAQVSVRLPPQPGPRGRPSVLPRRVVRPARTLARRRTIRRVGRRRSTIRRVPTRRRRLALHLPVRRAPLQRRRSRVARARGGGNGGARTPRGTPDASGRGARDRVRPSEGVASGAGRGETLREEQDAAFRESLEADARRAEEVERAAAEAARAEAERAAAEAKERAAAERAAAEAAERRRLAGSRRAEREAAARREEPAADAPGVCKVAVKFPNGGREERRFLEGDTVGGVYDFVDTLECAGEGRSPSAPSRDASSIASRTSASP